MADEQPWYETVSIPAMLRHARSAYGGAMRRALEAAGYDDIPGNGLYLIGGLALDGDAPIGEFVRQLGVSKQAAGQLVDTLVLRGYLARSIDEADRRQLIVTLTDRGRAAAAIQSAARDEVDAQLLAKMGADGVRRMRQGLAVLTGIARDARAEAED